MHFKYKGTEGLKVMKNTNHKDTYHANTNHKKVRMATLISEKVDKQGGLPEKSNIS